MNSHLRGHTIPVLEPCFVPLGVPSVRSYFFRLAEIAHEVVDLVSKLSEFLGELIIIESLFLFALLDNDLVIARCSGSLFIDLELQSCRVLLMPFALFL